MKRLLRICSAVAMSLIVVVAALATSRALRARADAKFVAGSSLESIELQVGTLTRRALFHLPKSDGSKKRLPVVFMLHGTGGTPESVVLETDWVAKAETETFLVVFPEATRPDPTTPAKIGRNNTAWNDGSGRFHAGEQDVQDVAFIAALLDHFEATYNIDKTRIFATGFSNCASMTFRLGLELSERFSAWDFFVTHMKSTPQ